MEPFGHDGSVRSLSGDFQRVHMEFCEDISKVLLRRVGDRHLAQDLVQETFLRYWKALGSGTKIEHPERWLVRVAINLSEDWRRSFASRQISVGLPDGILDSLSSNQDPTNDQNALSMSNVHSLLEILRGNDKLLLTLRISMGLGTDSIGDLLGIGQDAARMRLMRAFRRARLHLIRA